MGLARNSRQNPHFKELRGQNLENKGFRLAAVSAGCTCVCFNHAELILIGPQGQTTHISCGFLRDRRAPSQGREGYQFTPAILVDFAEIAE
jgi:hypothetical protein